MSAAAAEVVHPQPMHPGWCDLGHPDSPDRHEGRVSAYFDHAGDVKVSVSLTHDEDVNPTTGVDHGQTRVRLALRASEWFAEADSHLSPNEARRLAALLVDYAERAERRVSWHTEAELTA